MSQSFSLHIKLAGYIDVIGRAASHLRQIRNIGSAGFTQIAILKSSNNNMTQMTLRA